MFILVIDFKKPLIYVSHTTERAKNRIIKTKIWQPPVIPL